MSFTGDWPGYQRWDHFHFYETENGTNGTLESVLDGSVMGKAYKWKIGEIRMHFSTAFASVEYFKAYVSSILGSNHNYVLISQLMSDIVDFRLVFEDHEHLMLFSDDALRFSFSNASGVNLWGLEVQGWAVRG
jgi:hypothetical protein